MSSADASFTYDFSSMCAPDYEVAFSNTSTVSTGTITSYSWDLNGDNVEDSNAQNPSYSFNASGSYTVELTVTSSEGCESTNSEEVIINEKTVDFSIALPAEGCEGLAVSFEGTYSDAVNDPVKSWNWTFENGSEAGTGKNTSHTYNTRGEYDVTLSIETTNGCSLTTTKSEAVQVGQKPVISNITKPLASCVSDAVSFTATFTGMADKLKWAFSDGGDVETTFDDGTSPQSVSYKFTDDSENITLNVIASDNGCPSDPYELTDIIVNQPVARFSASKTALCSIPETVTFTNNSDSDADGTTYEWDFDGDGIIDSTDENPSFEYTTAGDYTVKLVVFNPDTGCTDEISDQVYVTTSAPDFITDKTVDCHPAEIEFTNQIAGNSSANFSIGKVEWDFNNDGTIDSSEENPTYTYTSPNSYGITMTVTEENGCVYSVEKDGLLSVNGPVASFTKSPDEACLGDEITFTNTTSKYVGDPADQANYSYSWNFGDGSTSTDKDPTHTYVSKEVFEVSLLVTDENTCSNSITESNSVIVPNLLAGFTTGRDIYCLGINVEFTNTASITNGSASITKYEWDLDGDGIYEINTASNGSQSFIFASVGTFTVKQKITSSLNCTDEFTKEITIVDGDGSFTPDAVNLGCAPASTTFRANDNDAVVESYSWDFGDGETSNKREPMHFYVNPGFYNVTLTAVLTGGCTKTSNQTVFVAGPVGDFAYNNLSDCADPNHEVTFTATNMQDVVSLVWDHGNGNLLEESVTLGTSEKTNVYNYTTKGTKLPILILTDDGTCGAYSYIREDLGRINTSTPPTVDFSKSSGANICENVEFQFSDLSVLTDDRYQIVSWSWDFNEDGVEDSNEKNPQFTYTSAGIYDVSLTVTTDFGCTASLTKTDFITVVSPDNLKDLVISITEPYVENAKFCSSDNVTFNGSATSTNGDGTISAWEWDFGDGSDASTQNAPYSYSTSDEGSSKTVTLTVTDNSQCVKTIIKEVSIYKVEADFSITTTPVLRGNNIAFADLSTTEINSVTDGTIDTWAWNFEEGILASSTDQNPSITYNTIGSDYDVDLTVTNNEGCTDNISKTVSVLNNPPIVSDFGVSGNEDNDIAIPQADFDSNFDTSLDPSQSIVKVKITSLPANGDLYIGATKISVIGTELTFAELANLKFVPDENWNGSTSFDYNAYDGYDYAVADASITITVDQVQDAPVVSDISLSNNKDVNTTFDIATFEDKFSDVDLVGNANPDFQKIKITVLPTAAMGVLKLNGSAVTLNQEIAKADLPNLVFEPTAGFVGDAIFSWNGSDGADYAVADAQVSINYFNTKAELTDENLGNSIKEDVLVSISQSDFIDNHSDTDVDDDPFDYIKITSLPSSGGVFSIGGSALSVGQEITYAQLATDIIFTPTNGYNGTITLEWDAHDGTELSEGPAKFTFTYVNTPPTVSDITKASADEDTQVDFLATDFSTEPTAFSDVDAYDNLTRIRIESLPSNGKLELDGVLVTKDQIIDEADLDKLVYTPNPDFNGTDSFTWNGSDGTDYSSSPATVNLIIDPVQDKPIVGNISKLAIEDDPVSISAQDFIDEFSDVDAPYGNPNSTLVKIKITSLPSNGTLKLDDVAVAENDEILLADIDVGTGLVFVPDAGYEGDSSFDWNGSDGLNYADNAATVTIKHTNTIPVVTTHDFGDKLEDLVFTITRADFETYYSDADLTDQQFDHVEIVSLPSSSIGAFTINTSGTDVALTTGIYSYSDLLNGLKFTPLAGANGTVNLVWNAEDGTEYAANDATFSFTYINSVPTVSDFSKPAVDEDNNVAFAQADFDSNYSDVDTNDSMEKIKITDLPDNGTLKYGSTTVALGDEIAYADLANLIFQPDENWFGTDSFKWTGYDGTVYSSESTVSLTVNSVNDIPTAADESVIELEDQTYTFVSTEFSNSYADVETAFAGIKIVSLETEGYLKVGTSDVSLNQILDLNDIADLTFSTDANENGTVYATFGFTVYDGEDFSTEVYTMTVNITPVNDEPSFSLKTDPNVTVDEDSGAKIINGQAISINKGAANELDQNLSFDLTNDNNSLFSSQPAIDAGGNLNFTLADDAFGTATVTVILKDDGGTANGGDDTSDSQTFVITVNSVNDIPIAADESVTELEDQTYTFASADFSNSYADVETAFAGIEITGLENVGNLEYDGIPVTTGLQIASVDISKLKFIPNADENGNAYDSFTFKVYDGEAYSADAYTMTLNFTPVNDEPSFTLNSPKDIEVDEDNGTETVVGQVVSQSEGPADESSQDLTLHVSHTNSGLFSVDPAINAAGTLTFTPTPNAFGTSTVTVYITDDGGTDDGGDDTSDSQTFVITVNSVNDAPVADNDSGTVDEGQSVTISLIDGDSDVDGTLDVTAITIVSGPLNGSIVDNGDGTITYTHDGSETASDNFTYTIQDNDTAESNVATVSIAVTEVNDSPVALDNNAITNEDTPVVILVLANDSDVDGTLDLTSLQVVSGPTNGSVSINPTTGEITYTPNADYHGNDEFTYQICDDDGACTTAVVYVVVKSENDTLVANNDTAETDEDTPIDIPVLTNDVDLDGTIDPGSLIIVGQASNGTLVVDNVTGIVSYTPNENFQGTDSFTYEVCDDQGACDFASVSITVNDVNDPPVALDNNAITDEDVPVVINVLANDSDVDGTLVLTSLQVVSGPTNGSVSINPTTGEVTYTPNTDYHGNDEFTYQICDDDGACTTAVVYVVVQSENDTLVANNDTAETDEDTPIDIPVLTNDVDLDGTIDPGSLIIVGQASNGTLVVDNVTGIVSYTPNENFQGTDSFTYEVCDDQGACDFASVSITVNDVNDPPVALDNNAITDEDVPVVINVLANDSDVDGTLVLTSLQVVSGPTNGSVSINPTTGEITYTPNADYHGNDEFTYQICDEDGACTTAVVYVVVQSENDTLVANNDTAETDEDTPVDIPVLTNDVDLDGTIDPGSLVIVGQASNGTLVVDNVTGIVSYTPDENFHGVDSFTYEVCDDQGACDFASVSITVNDVNDPPVALDNNAITDEDVPVVINVLANDSDVDGTLVLTSLQVVSGPTNGSVSINPTTGEITYTPNADYHGNDEFTYQICDDDGACTTAVVYVVVKSENDTLVANNDTAETDEDTPVDIPVLTNDVDLDGTIDPGSLIIVGQASNGTLVVDNVTGIVSYTPDENFHGVDSFTYEVCDDQGACDFASVSITVNDVNDPPVALDNNAITNEDTPVVILVLANDSDVDGTLVLTSLQVVSGPTNGSVSINPTTGEITYTPNADYYGNDEFTYQICDDDGACTTAVVYVEVVDVNDHMNAVDDIDTTEEDTPVTTQVLLNDTDIEGTIDPTSLSIYSSPSNGTVLVNADGTITYTPEAGFNGVDTYKYQVCDDGGFCDIATVSITVSPIDDAPIALDDTYVTPEDVAIFMDILANDSDQDNDLDPTTVSIITDPANGVVTVDPVTGQLYYIPNPNYHGTDEILYQVCDMQGNCTTATVTIIVNEQYDLPVANDDEEITPEDVAIDIDVLANDWDVDGNIDLSTLEIVNQPKNGTVTIDPDTGIITYTPNEGFNGLDLFSYNICDNNDHCDQATVSIVVTPVNDPPVAVNDYIETLDNTETTIRVLINDEDPDGDDLTVSIIEGPLHGTVKVESDGSITYKADLGYYCNTDTFVYSICDPYGLCDTAEVMITIDPLDSDSDRIPDAVEGLWVDKDTDGMPNFMDTDSDNDGISDWVESQIVDSCLDLPVDTDGDSIPDYLDLDSDNDGYTDEEEGDDDCDGDGIVDYLDAYDDCAEYVSIPEGFSPNGDGVNDFFVIKGIKDFPNSELMIFNRWGAKIYSKKGYQNDWDGRADNSLNVGSEVIPEGTYYYYVIDLGNGSKVLKGFIYINY